MNKKVAFYILIFITFMFPILSIEGIIPWIVSIVLINKSIKKFNSTGEIKYTVKNTILAGGIILSYNVIAKVIQDYLIKLWL